MNKQWVTVYDWYPGKNEANSEDMASDLASAAHVYLFFA